MLKVKRGIFSLLMTTLIAFYGSVFATESNATHTGNNDVDAKPQSKDSNHGHGCACTGCCPKPLDHLDS